MFGATKRFGRAGAPSRAALAVHAAMTAVGCLLVGGLVVAGAAPASAATNFTASAIVAKVTGTSVTVTANFVASVSSPVAAGFCVRNSANQVVDFALRQPVSLGSTATKITGTRVFPAGLYQYWGCVQSNGVWFTASARQSFRVLSPTTATIKLPRVGPAATTDNAPVNSTAMPVGDLPGWRQTFTEDFRTPLARGSFPGPYASKWLSYNGFKDTSEKGDYRQKIISVHDSALDMFLHTENGRPLGAAPVPLMNGKLVGQIYGRFSVRMKADSLPGYGMGFLLWSDTNTWTDGEIDFPEGGLDGPAHGYNHVLTNPSKNSMVYTAKTGFADWHVYTINWTPTQISFELDGVVVATTGTNIPSKPLHWVMQVGTTGVTPNPTVKGHLLIDWATIYTRMP